MERYYRMRYETTLDDVPFKWPPAHHDCVTVQKVCWEAKRTNPARIVRIEVVDEHDNVIGRAPVKWDNNGLPVMEL